MADDIVREPDDEKTLEEIGLKEIPDEEADKLPQDRPETEEG